MQREQKGNIRLQKSYKSGECGEWISRFSFSLRTVCIAQQKLMLSCMNMDHTVHRGLGTGEEEKERITKIQPGYRLRVDFHPPILHTIWSRSAGEQAKGRPKV